MRRTEAEFNARRIGQALETIRQGATLHEGLYEAMTDNLQWLESVTGLARNTGPELQKLLDLMAEPAIATVEDRMLAAVRAMSPAEIGRIVEQLERFTVHPEAPDPPGSTA
jgi:hypothetical protein